MTEFELLNPPTDGVSSLTWTEIAGVPHVMASAWDGGVYLYDIQANARRGAIVVGSPLLDSSFSDAGLAYTGCLDGGLREHNFETGATRVLGQHEDTIKCVNHVKEMGLLVTGSWDKTARLWDPRADVPLVAVADCPDKVFTMDVSDFRVVIATAGRHVYIFDMRRMDEPEQLRKSSLLHQTRCLRTYPDGTGYAVSSIEGRLAMEYFDPSPEVQTKMKYAFKCHRQTINGVENVYPVNAIAFHNTYGTFATGGCDGIVNVWDGGNKKRLCQFHQYPTSISALKFSVDGGLLAIASSYTYEQGEKQHPADSIFIRTITDAEVKPKPRV